MKMKKFAICSTVVLFLSANAAMADTMWTLNDVVTQSGATISGYFDIVYNSNPLLETLGNYSLTYTPTGGGAATVFDPGNNGTLAQSAYYPSYVPGNLPFPPPNETSFINFLAATAPGSFNSSLIELTFPVQFLADVGSGTISPVVQNLCTLSNDTPGQPGYIQLCDGNSGINASYFAPPPGTGGDDLVDPGTITGTYILGTAGPGGSTGGGGNSGGGVPEPGTLSLIVPGLVALVGLKLRNKMTARAV